MMIYKFVRVCVYDKLSTIPIANYVVKYKNYLDLCTNKQSHRIMKHQYQSNYKQNEFLDVVGTYENGHLKCQVTTYSPRGRAKVKTVSLWRENLEGQWANYHKVLA